MSNVLANWNSHSEPRVRPSSTESVLQVRRNTGVDVANGRAEIGSRVLWERRTNAGYVVLHSGIVTNITLHRITISVEGRGGLKTRSVSPKRVHLREPTVESKVNIPMRETPCDTEVLTAMLRLPNPLNGRPSIDPGEYAQIEQGRIVVRKLN